MRLGIDALRYPAKEHGNTIYYSIGGMSLMTFLLLIATGLLLIAWPFAERTPELDLRRRRFAMVVLGLAVAFSVAFTIWGAVIPPGHAGG